MRTRGIFVALLMLVLLTPAFAQQKVFQWQPANDESVRLDPAYYHAGRVYHPGPDGGGMHIDVQSALPVTIAMARSSDWSQAMQRHELLAGTIFAGKSTSSKPPIPANCRRQPWC